MMSDLPATLDGCGAQAGEVEEEKPEMGKDSVVLLDAGQGGWQVEGRGSSPAARAGPGPVNLAWPQHLPQPPALVFGRAWTHGQTSHEVTTSPIWSQWSQEDISIFIFHI